MQTLSADNKISTLTLKDKKYPINLKYIYDPPATLYVSGALIPEDAIAVAIVGSRRASSYGLSNAEKLSYALAARGITVISGLARGVDSAAHRGALKAKGRTIAVLGSGLGKIYPSENVGLAQEISRSGAVVSEFPEDTAPLPQNFPRRNRLISGLSLGVVVVEAAKHSGALITANCALEQGREVFALPGKVDAFTSQGTHSLIKEGAKLVESIDDIIEELEPLQFSRAQQSPSKTENNHSPELSEEEGKVYLHLSSEPAHLDSLIQAVNLSYGKLLKAILQLQKKQLIRELPGKLFVRV